jgi:Abnormal spindle-like microcephaly-assoc'd, ASPM-SPD-2-Hydin
LVGKAARKTTPTITWPTPAPITYGTALSATQLDATASVPGTFAYTPAAGTVPPAGTDTLSVTFTPTDTTTYNSATASVSLVVNAAVGVLSKISCASSSMSVAGIDACTITLTAAAGGGGLTISLASNSSAVTVPASVTVPAGSSSAGFAATVSTVTTAQTATLTATAGGVTVSYVLQLSVATQGAALTLQSTSVAFGTVALNTPATQMVTLTSSGTAPVTISAGAVTGTGFSISGVSFPVTLNPGQTATLAIQFDPTSAGAVRGTVTLTDNTSAGTAAIALSGTGQSPPYEVNLSWTTPSSAADPVVGYNIYRSTGGNSYQLLSSTTTSPTTYTDLTVVNGATYLYYVQSVDASGNQSAPSNVYTATIP